MVAIVCGHLVGGEGGSKWRNEVRTRPSDEEDEHEEGAAESTDFFKGISANR